MQYILFLGKNSSFFGFFLSQAHESVYYVIKKPSVVSNIHVKLKNVHKQRKHA